MNYEGQIPTPEELFSAEDIVSGGLAKKSNFRFLVQSGYEWMERAARKEQEQENMEMEED